MGEKKRIISLQVAEKSFVDSPAVPQAKFLIAKRQTPEPELTLEALEKRVAALEVVEPEPVSSIEEVLNVDDLARLQAISEMLSAPRP